MNGLICTNWTGSSHAGWRAWLAVTAMVLLPALGFGAWQSATGWGPTQGWSWSATAGMSEPWTCWTHAWVHLSPSHLLANSLGLLLLMGLAREARTRCGDAVAWALAWGMGPALLPF